MNEFQIFLFQLFSFLLLVALPIIFPHFHHVLRYSSQGQIDVAEQQHPSGREQNRLLLSLAHVLTTLLTASIL